MTGLSLPFTSVLQMNNSYHFTALIPGATVIQFLFFFPPRPVSQHLSFITAFIKLAVQSFPRQQFSESPSNPPLPIPRLWFLLLRK